MSLKGEWSVHGSSYFPLTAAWPHGLTAVASGDTAGNQPLKLGCGVDVAGYAPGAIRSSFVTSLLVQRTMALRSLTGQPEVNRKQTDSNGLVCRMAPLIWRQSTGRTSQLVIGDAEPSPTGLTARKVSIGGLIRTPRPKDLLVGLETVRPFLSGSAIPDTSDGALSVGWRFFPTTPYPDPWQVSPRWEFVSWGKNLQPTDKAPSECPGSRSRTKRTTVSSPTSKSFGRGFYGNTDRHLSGC